MLIWKLIVAQLRMYYRDRQSIFFAFFFPLLFMLALGFIVDGGVDPIDVSLVETENSASNEEFIAALQAQELLEIYQESEVEARSALDKGDRDLIIFVPEMSVVEASRTGPISLKVLINAADPQGAQQILTILAGVLTDVEHNLRGTTQLFTLAVEDVQTRSAKYVDFLIPGILAFMIMQLAIAGSGFNIVEYKRKGILKRLFVTPLKPLEFITSLIGSRLFIIIAQIAVLLIVANLVFDISIQGNLLLLLLFIIAGSILFLGFGFALGGFAKTQGAIASIGNLFIFPQIFLAGVFFPLDTLPSWLQPIASILPLSFVSDALRQIANEGAGFSSLGIDILGIAAWTTVGIFLAVRFFHWSESENS